MRRWSEAALGAFTAVALLAATVAAPPPIRPGPAAGPGLAVTATRQGALTQGGAAPAGADAVDFVNRADGWAVVGGPPCGRAPGSSSPDRTCRILSTTNGGTRWRTVYETSAQLHGLDFVDATHGLAWGPGQLLATADGGATWSVGAEAAGVPSSLDLVDAKTAVGIIRGTLERSRDGGRSWSPLLQSAACPLSSVSFAGPRDGWAAGIGPGGVCLYATRDGGTTWHVLLSRLTAGPADAAFGAFIASFHYRAPTAAGLEATATSVRADLVNSSAGWLTVTFHAFNPGVFAVLRTADGGASWRYAWGDSSGCLMGCQGNGDGLAPAFFLDSTHAWRYAPHGLARTTDGGMTWSPDCVGVACPPPGPSGRGALCDQAQCTPSVSFVDARHGWAASPQGIFETGDGGRTWKRLWPDPGLPGALAAVSFTSPTTGYAVPALGSSTLLRTTNAGRSWQDLRTPAPGPFRGLAFGRRGAGCLWQDRSLYCTASGGTAWRDIPLPRQGVLGTVQVRYARFTDPDHGWLLDVDGGLWRTANGGRSWRPVPGLAASGLLAVAATGTSSAWALLAHGAKAREASSWSLLHTGDGGATWIAVATWRTPEPNLLGAAGRDRVWLLTPSGTLLRSRDGGRTWTASEVPALAPLFPTALAVTGPAAGWLLTDGGALLRTANGGATWTAVAL